MLQTKLSYPVAALTLPPLLFALFLLLLLVAGCGNAVTQVTTPKLDINAIPHLITRIDDKVYGDRTAIHPDGRMYFLGDVSVSVVDGIAVDRRVSLPNLAPPYGQSLRDIGVEPDSGLVYILDNFAGAIHVISNTVLVTTLLGIVEQPRQIITDEDSGEMYVFYTSQKSGKPQPYVTILSEAKVITDIVLPVFSNGTGQYNAVDGHIYVAGYARLEPDLRVNALTVIDNHQVITTILPIDKPDLSVIDIAVSQQTGDIYTLLASKVVYWDRVHEFVSIDLYELGYKNLGCITIDPKRGWAYVCSWPGRPSYMLVVDKDQFVGAIEVEHWPYAAAADATHDYIYVAHYDPTYLSVIRETKLITTLDIIGLGTMNVTVDEERELIYTSNAGDGTISVFGFQQPVDEPSFWQRFLPFIGR